MEERIRQIIEYYGLSIRAFEQKIFVSESLIYRGLARNSDFSASVIAKILNYCSDISPDWLILGKGEMLRENCQNAPSTTSRTGEKDDSLLPPCWHPADKSQATRCFQPAGSPLWERYNDALIEVGTLRERLARASATIAALKEQREKVNSALEPTPMEPISA